MKELMKGVISSDWMSYWMFAWPNCHRIAHLINSKGDWMHCDVSHSEFEWVRTKLYNVIVHCINFPSHHLWRRRESKIPGSCVDFLSSKIPHCQYHSVSQTISECAVTQAAFLLGYTWHSLNTVSGVINSSRNNLHNFNSMPQFHGSQFRYGELVLWTGYVSLSPYFRACYHFFPRSHHLVGGWSSAKFRAITAIGIRRLLLTFQALKCPVTPNKG